MGRRLFDFGPVPRAKQASFSETSCRVATDSEDSWIPSRRLFQDREVTPGGSTQDSLCISPKRHTQPPESFADPNFTPASGKRHIRPEQDRFDASLEGSSAVGGRRHLHPPLSHFEGSRPEVVRDSSVRSHGRKHCSDLSTRPRSASEVRRATLPAQRRHLHQEDHMLGPYLAHSPPEPKPEGLRCSVASPTFADTGTREMLCPPTPKESERTTAPSRSTRSPGRRKIDVQDNLVGGMFRGGSAARNDPIRPSRRPGDDMVSMMGAIVRYAAQPQHRVRSPAPRRQDHLSGAACWPQAIAAS